MPRAGVTKGQLGKGAVSVGIEGIEEVKQKIAGTLNRTSGRALKKIFLRAGMIFRNRARELAPEDWIKEYVRIDSAKEQQPFVLVLIAQGKAQKAGRPNIYWWEYGTQERTRKSGGGTGKMTARPFFRPALTATKPDMAQSIAVGLKKAIEQ